MKRFLPNRKGVFALLLALFVGMGTAYAYTFSKVCSTGQRLYYNIIDATNHYVEITYPGTFSSPWDGFTEPTGNITLPSTVSYNGITYSVKRIGEYAFFRCSGLTGSLAIPNTVTEIGQFAFQACTGFTGSLNLGNSLTTIGNYAFMLCGFTGSLSLPNSLTAIGNIAFTYCTGFTGSLNIPNSVTTIGQAAFEECTGFNGTLTIGTGVTAISASVFKNCSGFTQVNYNATYCADVTNEDKPFEYCGGTLVIGSYVRRIPAYMFYQCTGFTGSLSIPNSVTTIGNYAFLGCSGFTGMLTIGTGVTSIGQRAFQNCSSFTQVNYNAVNCADVANNAHPFEGCSGSLIIGNNVQRIPAYMFNSAGFTGTMTIGTGVTSIGWSAFKDCTHCTRVYFNATNCADAVYSSYPFENCTGGLTIGSNVTRIPSSMFGYARFTGSLSIPDAVTTIGESAFYCCYYLTGSLSLGNSLTTIGVYAFYYCGFNGLLIIPNSVATLDTYAFCGCTGFTIAIIGSSVATMNLGAFYSCNGLTSMTLLPETPPTLGTNVFYGVPKNIPVYVPCSASDVYESTPVWNEFDLQCRPEVTITVVPTEGGSVSGGGTFNYGTQCTVTATPNSGYLFMHWSKNGTVVSSNATYSFYVYNDTDLEAVFAPQSSMGTIIGEGESTDSYLPSYSFYNYSLTQQIYTADELGGSRSISSISFFNAGSEKTRTYDIYLKHTSKSTFTSNTDWISITSAYKVYSGTVVMRAGQWTTIVFNSPFTYNGTSNLVLIVDDNTGSYSSGMSCRVYNADGNQAIRVYSDGTNYSPSSASSYTGTLMSVKNQIMLNRPNVYNITATSANTTMGTVTGGGTYGAGDMCRLKATARSGYTFLNWTDEDGVTVSTDANYSFTVSGSRSLTANFIPAGDYCSLTFDLYDTYGDGWNGNLLVVDFEDGTSVNLTVSDGYNETYTLPFVNGSHVDLSWIEGGWSYECYFTVSYENGDVMYMNTILDIGVEYGFDMDCAGQSSDVTYLGDHSTANNYYLPSYSYYNYSLSEQIYTAEEIGMEGYITSMAFYNSGAQETRYYEIYLATTDKTAFENETDWINASDAVLVYSGEVIMQAGKWTPIKFNENPFDYDGVSNLVLIVDDNTEEYTSAPHMSCLVYETQSLQALRVYGDNIDYNPMSPPTSYGNYEYHAVMNAKNQVVFGMVPCYEPTDLYVTDVTPTSAEVSWSSSHHNEFQVQYGLVNPNNNFENGIGYWTTIDADGDGYGWELATEATSYFYNPSIHAGTGHDASTDFVMSGSYAFGPLTPDNYLVSPQVTLGGSISFWACAQETNWPDEHFGVAVSTTSNTNASAFTTIQEWTMTTKGTGTKVDPEVTRSGNRTQGTWYQYTVDLSAYAGQTGYVAIRHFGCTNEFLLDVDDITIVQPGITPTMTTISDVTDTYVSLTDLIPGFQYEVRVRSHCGLDFYSDWMTTSFTPPYCGDAVFVDADNPFFEDFEGATFAPDCWENIPSINYNDYHWIRTTHQSHSSSHSAFSSWYGDIYLVMPNIELPANAPAAQLSFWSYNTYPSDFEVGNNKVVLLNGGTETVLWSAEPEEVIESWVKTTIDLSAYLGQTVSLAFKYEGDDGNGWYIDDVEVSVPSSVTQTIALSAGTNWVSTYVDITLADLKAALVTAMPGATNIRISSQNSTTTWNGNTWRGNIPWDVMNMYIIQAPTACEITLVGLPINPAEHPITISHGANWIAFPLNASMTPLNVFAGFAVNGDKISSQTSSSSYNGSTWRGGVSSLQPGKGYIYQSASSGSRTFTFPSGAK